MSEDALEHPIYRYGHSRFKRWIVQLTVQLPAYILLLWMAFIACVLVRSFANGMVGLKVTAVAVISWHVKSRRSLLRQKERW